jgi:hypothetical protein
MITPIGIHHHHHRLVAGAGGVIVMVIVIAAPPMITSRFVVRNRDSALGAGLYVPPTRTRWRHRC